MCPLVPKDYECLTPISHKMTLFGNHMFKLKIYRNVRKVRDSKIISKVIKEETRKKENFTIKKKKQLKKNPLQSS